MAEASALAGRLRLGSWVLVALIVLTVVEFGLIFVIPGGALLLVLLLLFQLADAGLIVWCFMHLAQLWRGEEAASQ